MTDYALWEVIVNGDSPPLKRTIDGVEQTYPPTTADEKLARKNELKARGTLLMALPNEHQLKFNAYKCAKTLMESIEKRFREGLDQTYDRLQKLISQLEILGETISQDDMNLKFLRSLPSEWKSHTLIWRNKPDLDTLSMDDLYKNMKIYETKVKGSSNSNQNSQNVAFVSSNNSGSSNQAYGSNSANTDSMSDVIDADDLEEMDLKWQMAMLTMRARRFLNKTRRKINPNDFETIGFKKSKVECYNCHKKGHFARECRAPRENRNRKPIRRNVTMETTKTKALVAQDGLRYDWSDQTKEGPINFALMAYKSSGSSSSSSSDSEVSTYLKAFLKSYKTLKEHYDNLTKDFNKSQLNVGAYKAGLESIEAGLDVYKKNEVVFEEDIKILKLDIKLRYNALTELRKKFEKAKKERDDLKLTLEKFGNSSKNLSKPLEIQELYAPKYDLVLADEGEYVFSKSVTSIPDVATIEAKTSVSKLKSVGEPLIKDWISDSEDENETEFKSKQRKPSFAKTEFVKSNEHVKTPKESVKKVENKRQAKYPRKTSQSPRGNQRNWNNLMTHKLGSNFEFKNKACYECGSFNHLIKDCDLYEKKMVEKTVWNNARRANHQNSQRMTHPHPKGNFVPKAVLMKSGIKTLNTAGQNFSKAAVSVNTARPINTAYPRPTVNSARTTSNVFNRAHTHVRRPFNKSTTNKNSNLKEKVNTVKGNVTTAGPKAVVSDNKGNEANGNPQYALQDQGILTDETLEIPKNFITGIENQSDRKGIRIGIYIARTPQQNGVVERKNRTLIEATRTMLVDSKLPTTFWAEAVNSDTGIFGNAYDNKDVGANADLNNLETTMNVSHIPTTRIHKDHPKEQIIGDINPATQTRRMIKMSKEHAMISYINKQRRTNHKRLPKLLICLFSLSNGTQESYSLLG
ncbi:ribonuclease H-like domain-containing protein [Tanacetum coccineum]|uniref:Ribonuclease H-like domain-containing protein n=1 Tax=Tanacetum coccineum TaxID=301880 RepID=A0ABQ5J4T3_9ASTR